MGVIKIGDSEEEAHIKKGVRQRCSLLPIIFNAYIQEIVDLIN